jgi:hypothetical protein
LKFSTLPLNAEIRGRKLDDNGTFVRGSGILESHR